MKKKNIAVILLCGLIMGMTACGSASGEAVETMNETVEEHVAEEMETEASEEQETTETTQEETTQEETTEEAEEISEEIEFDRDMAMTKFTNLLNARNALFANAIEDNDLSNLNFYYIAENLRSALDINLLNIQTKDESNILDMKTNWIYSTFIQKYFYDYVNNDTGYYSLKEWINSHTEEEIFLLYHSFYGEDIDEKKSINTNNVIMLEASGLLKYFADNYENMRLGDLRKGDECEFDWVSENSSSEISGISVYYELPIYINEEYCGATAVYDEEGNLLNVVTNEDIWNEDNYIISYDEIMSLGIPIE